MLLLSLCAPSLANARGPLADLSPDSDLDLLTLPVPLGVALPEVDLAVAGDVAQAFVPVATALVSSAGGKTVQAHPALRQSQVLNLNPFGGRPLVAERQHLQVSGKQDFVWSGIVRGEPLSRVTLASRNGVLAGVIDRPLLKGGNETFVIEPQPDGTSLLVQQDDQGTAVTGCAAIPVTLPKPDERSNLTRGSPRPAPRIPP